MSEISTTLERPLTNEQTTAAEKTQIVEKAAILLHQALDGIYRSTDKMFAKLMVGQWIGAIALAYVNSPITWNGPARAIHPHLWAAIFLGGAITLTAVFVAWLRPGYTSTRHILAVCQIAFSALLTDLSDGRIETHFHIFGSLAFMAFYRDWRVLITASIAIVLDHAIRGYFMPYSLYGVITASPWRWVEHAGWIGFEDIILIMGLTRIAREMRKTALQHAQLIVTEESLRASSAERERLLVEAMERADRDPLTGLLNHRAFHRRLAEEINRAEREKQQLAVVLVDMDNFKFFNDVYGHMAGDDVLRNIGSVLADSCRPYDVIARFGGDEFALVMPSIASGSAEGAVERVRQRLINVGYHVPEDDLTIPTTVTLGLAVFPTDGATRQDVIDSAVTRLRRAKLEDFGDPTADMLRHKLATSVEGFPMLDALVAAVDNKDRYTRRHSEDVMIFCLQIAEQLGLSDTEKNQIQVAALIHDVGKIGVPDGILRKPGKLTAEEYEAIKQHALMGAAIVGAVPGLEYTLDAVRHHHERWDGHGYPYRLAGEETPRQARIMAVADAFSAMTTDRPYRKGMSEQRALEILAEGAGSQWDPTSVEAFIAARKQLDPVSADGTPIGRESTQIILKEAA